MGHENGNFNSEPKAVDENSTDNIIGLGEVQLLPYFPPSAPPCIDGRSGDYLYPGEQISFRRPPQNTEM